MDPERLAFLYGSDLTHQDLRDLDLSDLEVRSRLLERSFRRELSAYQLVGREAVANQIFDDDPPDVWEAVKRLRERGYSREATFSQLSLAFGPVMQTALSRHERWDPGSYVQARHAPVDRRHLSGQPRQ